MALGLNLPIDIPWTRLAVSDDMIDRTVGNRQFPYRWRSSVAVFSYQPPDEDQTYPGMIVSYLKVVCTITGFQPDPNEIGLTDRRVDSYWNDPVLINHYKEMATKYYGCYGAILEVAVAPSGSSAQVAAIPSAQWPHFVDFEPKKRELYEIVSDTGEMMSRSLENVNVRKGNTTSDSHEMVDIFGGASVSAQGASKAGGSAGVQGQWGTRDVNQDQYENVRTTDQGREMRETYSHTTQLTQMYHQLDSYHLGTNRTVFFLLPRPHVVQSDNTFVNGPRLLEGIQEFFLVVTRPKSIAEICVEAYLETAHIASEPKYQYEQSTGTLTLHVSKKAAPATTLGDDSNITYAEDSETYVPPDGWEVDLDRGGGYKIESISGENIVTATGAAGQHGPPRVTEVARDHVTAFGQVFARFEDKQWPQPNVSHDGVLDMTVTVYIRRKDPTVADSDQSLWLTGRGVYSCPAATAAAQQSYSESVTYEGPATDSLKTPASGKMSIQDANRVRAAIASQLRQSVNHPNRYPFGTVRFVDTHFLARSLGNLIRGPSQPDNHPVAAIKGLQPAVVAKISRIAPKVSRGRLLQMPLAEQVDRFGLTYAEVISLRRALLGLQGPAPEPARRWDRTL